MTVSDFRGRLILNQVDSKIIILIDEIPYRMVFVSKIDGNICILINSIIIS